MKIKMELKNADEIEKMQVKDWGKMMDILYRISKRLEYNDIKCGKEKTIRAFKPSHRLVIESVVEKWHRDDYVPDICEFYTSCYEKSQTAEEWSNKYKVVK